MNPSDPIHTNLPFRNIRVHYSDSKDTTAMHALSDLYIVTDDAGDGGTLVSATRPFHFINTTNPVVGAAFPADLKRRAAGGGADEKISAEDELAVEQIMSSKLQTAKDEELRRSKALAETALKEMLGTGLGTVSPYTLLFTSHSRNCDACGKLYGEAEAESNANCCQSCVCCPDCGTVLEPAMHSDTKAAWVHCRNCHWRSAVQKDVSALNSYLMDLRLWGGKHENIRRRAEGAIRKVLRDNEKELSVSNEVLAERNVKMGYNFGGSVNSIGGATVRLMSTAGILGSTSSDSTNQQLLPRPDVEAEDSNSEGVTRTAHSNSVITDIQKTSARSKRVLEFDAKLQAKTTELYTSKATNYSPATVQPNWWLHSSQLRAAGGLVSESVLDGTFGGTTIMAETVGGANSTVASATAAADDLKSNSIVPLSAFKNVKEEDFEGPRAAPAWSEGVLSIKGAPVTGALSSQAKTVLHSILSTKTLLAGDSVPKGSLTGTSIQRMAKQNDGIGSTKWIKHAQLANRFAISHPLSGHLLYTPTQKDLLDGVSLSVFLGSRKNESLTQNTNAGRLLPWLRVASTQFSESYAKTNEEKHKKRIYCYLWNYGECDIKVTHINVVGTNGCTAVNSYEQAERIREAKDELVKIQRRKNAALADSTLDEGESTFTEDTIHASSTMSPSGKTGAASFGDGDTSPLGEALREIRHLRSDTAEGFGSAAEASEPTAIGDLSAESSPPPPENRDKPTPAPSPEYASSSSRRNIETLDQPILDATPRPRAGTATATSQHSAVVFLESRDKDIETLSVSYVVSDRQATELESRHFIQDCSKLLFYIDVADLIDDASPEKVAKMVALQVTATASVGPKRSKLHVQYNSYLLFE